MPFSHSTSAPQMQLKPGTWVVIGSSTAAGTGAPRGKGWAALLGSAYAPSGAGVVNIAKPGAVTYRGLSTNAIRVTRRPTPDGSANIDVALARKPVLLILSTSTYGSICKPLTSTMSIATLGPLNHERPHTALQYKTPDGIGVSKNKSTG